MSILYDKFVKKFLKPDKILPANRKTAGALLIRFGFRFRQFYAEFSFAIFKRTGVIHTRFTKLSTELTTFFLICVDKCVNPCYNISMLKRSVRKWSRNSENYCV